MKLYVTRHGETDYNAQGRYAGSTDIPLNETGMRQADVLAQRARIIQPDVVISSPMLRAIQTAEIVCRTLGIAFEIIDAFTERNVGVYEGLTREEVKHNYPELWNRKCTIWPDDAPTGGETLRACDARIAAGLAQLQRDYPDKSVLLICHGFVSRTIHRQYMGIAFEEMHEYTLGNCEITAYTVSYSKEE